MYAEVQDEFVKSTILYLAEVLIGDSEPMSFIERAGSRGKWESYLIPSRFRSQLGWKELRILRKLLFSRELNKYQLKRECQMHQTQVVRTVRRLRERRAIEIVSHKVWRTGKRSDYYGISAVGTLLLFHERMHALQTRALLTVLRDFAHYTGALLLDSLIGSIEKIDDKKIKRQHTLVLMNLAFDLHTSRTFPKSSILLCEFVRRAWCDLKSIRAYLGHLPNEGRWLLIQTKEILDRGEHEIDFLLRQRKLTDYSASSEQSLES